MTVFVQCLMCLCPLFRKCLRGSPEKTCSNEVYSISCDSLWRVLVFSTGSVCAGVPRRRAAMKCTVYHVTVYDVFSFSLQEAFTWESREDVQEWGVQYIVRWWQFMTCSRSLYRKRLRGSPEKTCSNEVYSISYDGDSLWRVLVLSTESVCVGVPRRRAAMKCTVYHVTVYDVFSFSLQKAFAWESREDVQ